MDPHIMIFKKDAPDQVVSFSAGAVFHVPDDNAFYVRGKEQNILLLEGDVLIKFEDPHNPDKFDFYLIGKEHFINSEEETRTHGI